MGDFAKKVCSERYPAKGNAERHAELMKNCEREQSAVEKSCESQYQAVGSADRREDLIDMCMGRSKRS